MLNTRITGDPIVADLSPNVVAPPSTRIWIFNTPSESGGLSLYLFDGVSLRARVWIRVAELGSWFELPGDPVLVIVGSTTTVDGIPSRAEVFLQVVDPFGSPTVLGVAFNSEVRERDFVPIDFDGCILWLRGDLGITPNGGDVAGWDDQGPDSNDGVQVTPANQPAIVASSATLNGQATVDFNGTTDGISFTAAWTGYTSNDYTLNAAIVDRDTSGTHTIIGADVDLRMHSARTNLVSIYDGLWRQGPAAVTGPQILRWEIDSSIPEVRFYRNGVHIGTELYDGTSALPKNNVDVGAYLAATTWFFNGEMAELVLFNRITTAGESLAIDGYLFARYGF